MPKFLMTSKVAVFVHNGVTYTVMRSNTRFDDVINALKKQDFAAAERAVKQEKPSKITIRENDLYFQEEKFDPIFAEAYAVAKEHGLSIDKLELFFKNLSLNPSPISIDAFSAFVAKSKMPITDRGTFLAYKNVSDDYLDLYTGQFDNRPGAVCTMPRNDVDPNQGKTCSTGFHVCSYEYLVNYPGQNTMVVEIHPKDVVAVPPDYQRTKMRVASYRVLSTLEYFKEKLLTYEADALGNIPIFNTEYFKNNWSPFFEHMHLNRERKTNMTPEVWLKSRESAV